DQLGDAVGAPHGNQVDQAAAPDIDRVLLHRMGRDVDRVGAQAKQGDVTDLAPPAAEGAAKTGDLVFRVAARRRQQADPGLFLPGQLDDVFDDRFVAVKTVDFMPAHDQDAPLDLPYHQATSTGVDAQGIGDSSTRGTWSGEPR